MRRVVVAVVGVCVALCAIWGSVAPAAAQTPPVAADFQKVALDLNTANPMELDIAPDGRVFYIERNGEVNIIKRDPQVTVVAGNVPVTTSQENGLLGITLAPDFATSGWIYLFYSQLPDSSNTQVVSRFKVVGDTLDLQSEQKILTFTHQRSRCCHSSGSLDFGPDGSLYISTGDNTDPFESSGYTPIDERAGRMFFDAQRTSANTNDLNGKFLRIKPMDVPIGPPGVGTTYTIPEGNLFDESEDTADKTRPEIFAMGFRNPFRFTVDERTGWLLMGDYGPDASSTNANRGPQGSVEYNTVTEAGNYGWPYCIRNNVAYNDYNFQTATSGAKFDCANPVNDSPNNTGLRNLPPAQPADAWMGYTEQDPRHTPNLGTGGAPMGGPRYYFDPENPSPTKFPSYYHRKWFTAEWNNGWIKTFDLNDQGAVTGVSAFARGTGYLRPMDLHFGPDGALYVIEWGSGFNGNNADSGIYRIDHIAGNERPSVRASGDPTNGLAPLAVSFSSAGTSDPEGNTMTYRWDFGDGATSTEPNPRHTYTENGNYTARLVVTDSEGATGTDSVRVVVGNRAPTVKLTTPGNGQVVASGSLVRYAVEVTDADDGTIDCSEVTLNISLGHDQHAHELSEQTGCSGTFRTSDQGSHGAQANVFDVIEAVYTDHGGPDGAEPLTGRSEVVLQPARKQAEYFSSTGRTTNGGGGGTPGVTREPTTDADGGQNITGVEDGDYISIRPLDFKNVNSMTFRVASQASGGRIQLVLDDPNAAPIATTADIPPTLGSQTWTDVTLNLTGVTIPKGEHELFLVFRTQAGQTPVAAGLSNLLNVNWVQFNGNGAAVGSPPAVSATRTPASGFTPLTVQFDGTASDPDGGALTYKWDFGVPGTEEDTSSQLDTSYTYTQPGSYVATLTVTDRDGNSSSTSLTTQVSKPRFRVLVFSKTAGFRHSSIDEGHAAIDQLAAQNSFVADHTEDAAQFTAANLAKYQAVIWLSTTGDVLNATQQAAFEEYIRAGGGYVGIHAASDTEYAWSWYGSLVGAYFLNHPAIQTATVRVEGPAHPSTAGLPASISRSDEWYNYKAPPSGTTDYSPRANPNIRVLMNIDENSYDEGDGTAAADDHPVSWCQRYDGGRSWYTGMGHTEASFQTDANFLKHLLGGIETVAGYKPSAECGVRPPNTAPTVSASADPTSGTAPLVVSFTASGVDPDGDELQYRWDLGDGATSSERTPSHTYTTPGTYTATVTVTDGRGGEATDAVVINVAKPEDPNNPPAVSADADRTSGAAPLAVGFTAVGSDPDGDDLAYSWDFGDGGSSDEQNPSHTYDTPGTYTARVTVTDGRDGAASDEVIITVSEPDDPNTPPVVSAAANPTSGAAPLPVAFTADGFDPDGDELVYVWDFGDGASSSAQNPTHTYEQAGTYTATVTVLDGENAHGTDSVVVTVTAGVPGTVVGKGWVDGARSEQHKFDLEAEYKEELDKYVGSVKYERGHLKLRSRTVDSVVISGRKAVITGTGEVDPAQGANYVVAYRVQVEDLDGVGGADTFAISWPGFSFGGPLSYGNVAITPGAGDDDEINEGDDRDIRF